MLDYKPRHSSSIVLRCIAAILAASCLPQSGLAEPLHLIGPLAGKGYRVKTVFEVTGKLVTRDRPNASAAEHPLNVLGEHVFEERVLDAETGRSLRYYQQAKAKFVVDGRANSSQLRDSMRWIVVDPTKGEASHYAPLGPLTRYELDLVEVPGASSLINRLLPKEPVTVDEKWHPSDELLAQMLGLDHVTANEVQSQIVEVDDELVRMTLAGNLIGSVEGVVTDVELTGKFNYSREAKRIVWLALAISEDREIGVSTPGLKVTARLRMVIGSDAELQHLDRQAIKRFGGRPAEAATLLEHTSDNGDFMLLHDRRWHVFTERPAMTVLRCIEDDRMIAQCNIRMLPAAGQPLTMTKFQQGIRESLGESIDQIVDTQETSTAKGDEVLRVVATGNVSSTPIQWVYYHVTHEDGRRLSCVFTMSADDVERFGAEDLSLIETLDFLTLDAKAKVTAARAAARR